MHKCYIIFIYTHRVILDTVIIIVADARLLSTDMLHLYGCVYSHGTHIRTQIRTPYGEQYIICLAGHTSYYHHDINYRIGVHSWECIIGRITQYSVVASY